MYSLALLQCLLQICYTSADFAAESLLKFSTAVDEQVLGGSTDEAVGDSHKYEQYVPAPPGFSDEISNEDPQFTFGLKSKTPSEGNRDAKQIQSTTINKQEVKKEENIVRNNRGARKFESFGGRQQQQQQLFRNNFQERASDKEQWNRIYDTFNNWNDDAEHDNDDWNNQFDRDDNNNDLDAYHHDWDDNVQNDEHFANFQFEIKKLSESYSGSEASSNHPSYNSDDARNQNHRRQEDTVPQDNYKTIEQQRPQTFDNQGFQWSKAGIDQPQSPVFYADDTIKDAPPVYNTNSASIRMHRKPTSYPKSRSKARLQSYQVKDDIQEPVQKIVLPAPTKFQDYNRRISSQFQDKFYNDENVADFEFHDAADGYKNSFDYQRNPIREEFVQNDGWGSSSSDSSSGFADSEQKYPYPYQRPVFEVPDLEFDIQPIRIKEKEPSYQPETVSKSEYYYKPPSKPVERQTTKSRNPNSYIYLDEATKILSEPQPSKSYLDKYKPKQEPSEDIPASIDDLKNRPRGNRRVEDNVFRQEDSSRGYNRIPDYTKKQRGYRRIEDSANEGYRSEDNRVIGGYRLLDDSANEGYRRVDDSTSGGYRRVDENSNGGYRRVEDSASGESYQHGVSDHHGGIEAAVVAGANHFSPEHYEQPQRLAFQVHGQEGPQSYRFGHDTGVGYNRQFRYEERDSNGVVHGRYGYYDQHGKLNIVNYTADPYKGFHAEGEHVPQPQYRR